MELREFARNASRRLTENVGLLIGIAFGAILVAVVIMFWALWVAADRALSGPHTVVVASTPVGATIQLEGKMVGKAPLRLELKRGTYTIGAQKPGYIETQQAIYVSTKAGNVVNVLLLPEPQPANKGAVKSIHTKDIDKLPSSVDALKEELKKLRSIILANPEDAASLPIVQEKIRVQSEEIKSLKEDIKDVKELTRWVWGSMIAIIVGLLAVVATLFVSQKGK